MQTVRDGDHRSSGGHATGSTQGVLDDPDGVTRLYQAGSPAAKLYDVSSDYLEGFYQLNKTHGYHLEWRRWVISRLVWTHRSSMLFLQGATLQQLVAPLYLLAGTPRHVSSPEPGLDNVVLAELYATSSDDLTYPQLFQLLAPEARGA